MRTDLATDGSPSAVHDLAESMVNLARTRNATGDRRATADAAERAVTLFRGLVDDDPSALPDLAAALTNRAVARADIADPRAPCATADASSRCTER